MQLNATTQGQSPAPSSCRVRWGNSRRARLARFLCGRNGSIGRTRRLSGFRRLGRLRAAIGRRRRSWR
jgi:hypothetical protein